jgi:glycosyltransferase involved in cell wall biosynthesis
MRALALLPCRFWGGPEKQTLRLAQWLRDERQVETVIAVMPPSGESADRNPLIVRAREAGFEVLPFQQRRPYNPVEGSRILRELVTRYRPDVVWATGYKADFLAAWLDDVATLAHLRGWTGEDAKVRFFEWLDRRSLAKHDAITVVSRALRDEAIKAGVNADRVFWLPNAIDAARVPQRRDREEFCREIGADPARPLIGAVGRLSPEKGHRVLLTAFEQLARRLPRAQLALVGDGREEASLRKLAAELGIAANVKFVGLRADGQQIIGALDVMALPSLSEGMPNVVLEAFVYGIPVVATAVGGVTDMVDARSGWLVTSGDPSGLAAALQEALECREEARQRALRAREALSKNFTVEKQADAWCSAAESAIRFHKTRQSGMGRATGHPGSTRPAR